MDELNAVRIVLAGARTAQAMGAASERLEIARRNEEYRREIDPNYRAFAERKDAQAAMAAAARAADAKARNVRALKVLLTFFGILAAIVLYAVR
jgi:hypothetical protein